MIARRIILRLKPSRQIPHERVKIDMARKIVHSFSMLAAVTEPAKMRLRTV